MAVLSSGYQETSSVQDHTHFSSMKQEQEPSEMIQQVCATRKGNHREGKSQGRKSQGP